MKSPPPSPLTWEQTCDDDIFLKFKCMELMNVYEKIIVCENVTCLLMCYEGLMSKECFVGLGKIPLKTHVYFMSILKAAPNTTPLKYWCSILNVAFTNPCGCRKGVLFVPRGYKLYIRCGYSSL